MFSIFKKKYRVYNVCYNGKKVGSDYNTFLSVVAVANAGKLTTKDLKKHCEDQEYDWGRCAVVSVSYLGKFTQDEIDEMKRYL